jgi:hypothetical protein
MTTLIEFLRTRLDEDERIARAAVGRRWRAVPASDRGEELEEAYVLDEESQYIVGLADTPDTGATCDDAAHIARHDPARVLAEVDAKRRTLTYLEYVMTTDDDPVTRSVANQVVEFMAGLYADHPDYVQAIATVKPYPHGA